MDKAADGRLNVGRLNVCTLSRHVRALVSFAIRENFSHAFGVIVFLIILPIISNRSSALEGLSRGVIDRIRGVR